MKQLLSGFLFVFFSIATAAAQEQADPLAATLAAARTLVSNGQPKAALEKLRTLPPTAQTTDPRVAHLLGVAHYQAGEHARAVALLTPIYDKLPADSAPRREVAQILGVANYLLGRLAESVPFLEATSQFAPDNVEITYTLGMASIQTRRYEQARAAFARMFKVATDSPAAHLVTAQMMIRVEFEEFAEIELKKALEKDAKLPQANYLLGQIAIYKGRLDEGIALLERELTINPGNANAYYKLGDAYTRQLKWDEAITALQKSIWLNPFYSGPYILLGKSYLKKRQLPNAEGMLKRAIQFDPNNKSAHYLLGQVYQQSNRPEEARRAFAIAEKLQGNPEQPEK